MDLKELKNRILSEVEDFVSSDESFGDTAMLCVNKETGEVDILDGEELTEDNLNDSSRDYYDMMDLLEMDPVKGTWLPDMKAIEAVSEEYQS